MRWDARQQSNVQKHFDLVARADDGTPKVMCKRYKRVLDHPQQYSNSTTAMVKHLKGISCRTQKGPRIKQFLQEVELVYDLYIFKLILFDSLGYTPFEWPSIYLRGLGSKLTSVYY